MLEPHFDRLRRRLTIRYTGFWSPEDAHAMVARFREVIGQYAQAWPRGFTLLDDCRDWQVQSSEVVEVTRGFVDAVRAAPVVRNAMIVPRVLLRMQIGRTLHDLPDCAVFDRFDAADGWLAEVEPVPR